MKINQLIKNYCKFLGLLLLSTTVFSQDQLPETSNYWLRAAPPNAMMQAAYVEIKNSQTQDIILIDAYSPAFKMTEIHKTVITDGIARMKHQPELSIAAQESLIMKPGGLHIMLMNPIIKFQAGDKIKINLIYRVNGERLVDEIWFPVEKR